jgi:hygromycin-B 4-O-kinase
MREDAINEFLRDKFGSGARVGLMRPGAWSAAYSVQTGTADLVVRFSAYDEDFEKDAYAGDHWASPDLPIPRILEWGPALDGYYAVADRMPGERIDGLDEAGMRRVLRSLFAALDAMRLVDLSAATGFGGWRADGRTGHPTWRETVLGVGSGPGTRGAATAREMLADSPVGVRPFEEGYARLRELADHCPEQRHLIHDDLINYNVLAESDSITAVLDWGSSMYGDFLYDIAKLVFYQPWYPAWQNIDFAAEARAHYEKIRLDVPSFDERLLCYALRIGLADMGYGAFRQRWDEVRWNARRIRQLTQA